MVGLKASTLLSLLVLVSMVAYVIFTYQQMQILKHEILREGSCLTYSLTTFYNEASEIVGQLSVRIINITKGRVHIYCTIMLGELSNSLTLSVDTRNNEIYELEENTGKLWMYWIGTGNFLELEKFFGKCNVTLGRGAISVANRIFEKYYIIQCQNATLVYDYETGILLKAHNYSDYVLKKLGVSSPCNIKLSEISTS